MKENKNGGGKGGKYLGKENISFVEEKKNREGKGGKYWKRENVTIAGQRTNERPNKER